MRFRKSWLAVAGSLAMAVVLSAPAGAVTTINVSNDTITCNSIVGKMKYLPTLTNGGTLAGTEKWTAKLGGCTSSAATTVVGGTVSGILATSTNDCSSLLGLSTGTSGNLIVKWKTLTGQPKITPTASTVSVTQFYGSEFNGAGPAGDTDTWGGTYHLTQMGIPYGTSGPSVTGAFRGSAGSGAFSYLDVTSGEDTSGLAISCLLLGGIKGWTFGIGGLTLDS